MIKKLFTLAIAGMMSVATLSAQNPELKWATSQEGDQRGEAVDITPSTDGNVYVLNHFYAKDDPNTAEYFYLNLQDGTKTSEFKMSGAADDPNGENANGVINMSFYKLDKDGHIVWALNSNMGDFAGGGKVAGTADGGALLALKMRNAKGCSDANLNTLINIVDKDGVETKVEWPHKREHWAYQPVFVKVSKDGKVEWTKHVEAGYLLDGNAIKKEYIDGFKINGVVEDEDGNFIVAGSFTTSINFGEKANFTKARNVNPEVWDGDTQGDYPRDIYIAKLDKDFNPIWGSKLEEGVITAEQISDIAYVPAKDGNASKLMLVGYLKGNGTNTVKIGKNDVVAPADKSMFYAEVNPETGAFVWGKSLKSIANSSSKKGYAKPMGINAYGNNIYLCGSFQGDMFDGEKQLLNSTARTLNGYIIKADATTGEVASAVHVKPVAPMKMDISEIQAVYETNKYVMATGYGLMSSSNIYVLDKNCTAESLQVIPIKKSKNGVSFCSALVENYMLVNAMNARYDVTFPQADNIKIAGSGSFYGVYTGHNVSSLTSVAENLANEGFKVIGGVNEVIVETAEACDVNVYNMMGCLVANQQVYEGKTSISLEKGIYIVNGVKTIVR